jgi:formylglycine-generating enzyme required for sulfatase activity
MIVVPPGTFTMGSSRTEPGRRENEGPQRKVTIARQFAVGQFELTFDEWDACIADGGCNGY